MTPPQAHGKANARNPPPYRANTEPTPPHDVAHSQQPKPPSQPPHAPRIETQPHRPTAAPHDKAASPPPHAASARVPMLRFHSPSFAAPALMSICVVLSACDKMRQLDTKRHTMFLRNDKATLRAAHTSHSQFANHECSGPSKKEHRDTPSIRNVCLLVFFTLLEALLNYRVDVSGSDLRMGMYAVHSCGKVPDQGTLLSTLEREPRNLCMSFR